MVAFLVLSPILCRSALPCPNITNWVQHKTTESAPWFITWDCICDFCEVPPILAETQAAAACISCISANSTFIFSFSRAAARTNKLSFGISTFQVSDLYKDADTHFVSCSFGKVACFKLMFSSLMAFESFTPQ